MLVFGQTILRCVQTVRLYIRTYVLDTMTYAAWTLAQSVVIRPVYVDSSVAFFMYLLLQSTFW